MNKELEFLYESNIIEDEPSGIALLDAAKAWNYISKRKKLRLSDIHGIHYELAHNLNPRIAGRLRTVNVQVGGRIKANPASIGYMLDDLLKIKPKTWAEIKKWHIDFEEIHPFEDFNGRTGRIIMNWHRKINKLPILIIRCGESQMDYYDWFKK